MISFQVKIMRLFDNISNSPNTFPIATTRDKQSEAAAAVKGQKASRMQMQLFGHRIIEVRKSAIANPSTKSAN